VPNSFEMPGEPEPRPEQGATPESETSPENIPPTIEPEPPVEATFVSSEMHAAEDQARLASLRAELGLTEEVPAGGGEVAIERGPERIPTRAEVVERITRYNESAVVTRERSDAEGLYLLEADAPGGTASEVTQYAYMRKGQFDTHQTAETTLSIVYYEDGVPVGGNNLAGYRSETGEWEEVAR
jgi:hypothetical protein